MDVEEACAVGQVFAILRSLKREVGLGPVRREESRVTRSGNPAHRVIRSRSSRSGWAITWLIEADPHAFRASLTRSRRMPPTCMVQRGSNRVPILRVFSGLIPDLRRLPNLAADLGIRQDRGRLLVQMTGRGIHRLGPPVVFMDSPCA